MDSIAVKLQQVKTAWEEFYNSMGIESAIKDVLDFFAKILTNLSNMNKVSAFSSIFNVLLGVKNLISGIFKIVQLGIQRLHGDAQSKLSGLLDLRKQLSDVQKINLDDTDALAKLKNIKTEIDKIAGTNIPVNINGAPTTNVAVDATPEIEISSDTLKKAANIMAKEGSKKRGMIKDGKITNGATSFIGSRVIEGWKDTPAQREEAQAIIDSLNKETEKYPKLAKKLGKNIENVGEEINKGTKSTANKIKISGAALTTAFTYAAGALQTAGAAITAAALTIEDKSTDNVERSKTQAGWGQMISGAGGAISGGLMGAKLGPVGMFLGALVGGAPSWIAGIKNLIDGYTHTVEEKLEKAKKELQELENEEVIKKGEFNTLKQTIDEINELAKAQYNSTEDMEAYKNKLAEVNEIYPSLVTVMGDNLEVIYNATEAERLLALARKDSLTASIAAARKELEIKKLNLKYLKSDKSHLSNDKYVNIPNFYEVARNGRDGEILERDEKIISALALIADSSTD